MHEQTPELRGRPGLAVRASRTARGFLSRRGKGLLIAVVGGVFLAASGAFDTGDVGAALRFPYWIAVMLAGGLIGGIIGDVFIERGWLERSRWVQGAAMTAAMTAPLTVVVWALTSAILGEPWRAARLLYFLPPVVIVSAVMTALNVLIEREPPQTHAPDVPAGASAVRFLQRLPPRLRGADLYAVAAEDHYLRLHTSRGSALILLRLADAVAELDGVEGAQTHRSWWVARAAVVSAERADGRASLTLADGTTAPVSRTYAKALRDAGWF